MATSSPGQQSIHVKSPRSPRQLPQLPQIPISGQRSPTQLSVTKTPNTPSVFEFPSAYYAETSNVNFDFDEFARSTDSSDQQHKQQQQSLPQRDCRSPSYYSMVSGMKSPKSPKNDLLHSPGRKSPIFQFCEARKNLGKTMSYPPKNPISNSAIIANSGGRSYSSANFTFQKSGPKSPFVALDRGGATAAGRRNSSFGFPTSSSSKSPMSPTIVTPPISSASFSSTTCQSNFKHPEEGNSDQQQQVRESRTDGTGKEEGGQDETRDSSSSNEKIRMTKMSSHFNRSQGCLNEAGRNHHYQHQQQQHHHGQHRVGKGDAASSGNDNNNDNVDVKGDLKSGRKTDRNIARKSTSDLTEIGDAETEVTLLSSPRRRGSMKGGLAYLASRRGSRDSQCSNISNISNEDVGPLNFNAHPRARQRRTSNFLELPVPDHIRPRVHSLPEKAYNPRAGDDLYRLRAFSITHKGVVNRGDSIISRRSRSNTSVNSSRIDTRIA